jgi:hypothetical protein
MEFDPRQVQIIRPASYSTYSENNFPPGDTSDHGVTLTTHLDRVTRFRMTEAVILLTPHTIKAWAGKPLLLTFLWSATNPVRSTLTPLGPTSAYHTNTYTKPFHNFSFRLWNNDKYSCNKQNAPSINITKTTPRGFSLLLLLLPPPPLRHKVTRHLHTQVWFPTAAQS